jgi:hypothetical protein
MPVVRKLSIAGILAVLASLAITGAAAAGLPDRSVRGPLDGNTAASRRLEDTSDFVHIIKVERLSAVGRVAITLRIDRGFHINANPASLPYLIPTSVSFAGVAPYRIDYPASVRFKPKFSDEPLDVYEGTVTITASFAKGALDDAPAFHATVTAQACTDQICLPPAELAVLK